MSLYADFLQHQGKVIHKWKHYFPIYERHFAPWVNKTVTVLEIGCGNGGSLQMWREYFGPHATIVGIDIEENCRKMEDDQIFVRIGAQQDPDFLASVIAEFGAPDIVIDDGSHVMSHIMASFAALYASVPKNGVYLVEDLHTAYWPEYEGGLNNAGTFIEFAKGLIDELNYDHIPEGVTPTQFGRTTLSMHFYDSVAVFEKGVHTRKWAPRVGDESI